MTYRSESRGIMYTAPPSGDEGDGDVRTEESADSTTESAAAETPDAGATEAADGERATPTVESTSASTDANWTGSVPADD